MPNVVETMRGTCGHLCDARAEARPSPVFLFCAYCERSVLPKWGQSPVLRHLPVPRKKPTARLGMLQLSLFEDDGWQESGTMQPNTPGESLGNRREPEPKDGNQAFIKRGDIRPRNTRA